ncbi:MAG: divalent-cation tolerance protein CutA [Candidatus Omnitrophica bacterium]|nr:divalent-cation tolerance protein CutA [Candidatus Omnitrophota bacterium]
MYNIIFITVANKKEANYIAEVLLKKRLVACVNIVDKIESLFRWKGKIDRAKENLLIVKTRKSKLSQIIKLVKSVHSYEVPEIIALPIVAGFKPYLNWIDESLR